MNINLTKSPSFVTKTAVPRNMIRHLIVASLLPFSLTSATPLPQSVASRASNAVGPTEITRTERQLSANVEHFLGNDNTCSGVSDEGHLRTVNGDSGDCWTYDDGNGNPLPIASLYVTPTFGESFTVTAYSDDNCAIKIGTVGPVAPVGLCVFSAEEGQDAFSSYTFDYAT
jgi:hypothetical protein